MQVFVNYKVSINIIFWLKMYKIAVQGGGGEVYCYVMYWTPNEEGIKLQYKGGILLCNVLDTNEEAV